MKIRRASIIELRRQPGQVYLVAHGCPHPRPDDAPFYACMFGTRVQHPTDGRQGFATLAMCAYLKGSDDPDASVEADRVVKCAFEDGPGEHEVIGRVGTPTVTHGQGDSDGGDPD